MYQPITYSLLVEKHACPEQLALVKKYFGLVGDIPLTKEVAIKFGGLFDITWAEYKKAIAVAFVEIYKKGVI